MLIVSKIIINSALKRKESRGLHYVKDFPEEKMNIYMTQSFKRRFYEY